MSKWFQRLTAFAAALVIVFPLSSAADSRTRGRTDLERLAAELEARLGRGSVAVERGTTRTPVDPTPTAASRSSYAEAIVYAMNRERAARGLAPLRLETRLSLAAQDRVDDMLSKHYFDHVSPDGINPFEWVRKRGYKYNLVGENLALGYSSSQSVVSGWMNSPGHRANILKSGFDEVGIAFSDSSPMRGYGAPLVVALYGRR